MSAGAALEPVQNLLKCALLTLFQRFFASTNIVSEPIIQEILIRLLGANDHARHCRPQAACSHQAAEGLRATGARRRCRRQQQPQLGGSERPVPRGELAPSRNLCKAHLRLMVVLCHPADYTANGRHPIHQPQYRTRPLRQALPALWQHKQSFVPYLTRTSAYKLTYRLMHGQVVNRLCKTILV